MESKYLRRIILEELQKVLKEDVTLPRAVTPVDKKDPTAYYEPGVAFPDPAEKVKMDQYNKQMFGNKTWNTLNPEEKRVTIMYIEKAGLDPASAMKAATASRLPEVGAALKSLSARAKIRK